MKLKIATALLLASASGAGAASFSFTGAFDTDADTQMIWFDVATPSEVTLRTFSYGGGTQSDGNVVADGGFDTGLVLYDATGSQIDRNDDGDGGTVGWDQTTNKAYDAYLTGLLDPGSYTAVILQYDNKSAGNTLADGFTRTDPDFTQKYGCSNGSFCDYTGSNRTADWAFDAINVASASTSPVSNVPEIDAGQGLGSLAALGSLLVFLRSRRRRA